MNQLSEKINKGLITTGIIVASTIASAVPCLADGAGTADTGVTTAFSTAGSNTLATVEAVAPYAITIFVAILGFRYGKKIFKLVAGG